MVKTYVLWRKCLKENDILIFGLEESETDTLKVAEGFIRNVMKIQAMMCDMDYGARMGRRWGRLLTLMTCTTFLEKFQVLRSSRLVESRRRILEDYSAVVRNKRRKGMFSYLMTAKK
jgi:hypothetical protein